MKTETKGTQDEFHEELLLLYERAGRATGYWANRFRPKVKELGGVTAAKRWLASGADAQDGLWTLVGHNRLDLSLEHTVLQERWSHLFSPKEREVAQGQA